MNTAINEEDADIPKINNLFHENCVAHLKVSNSISLSSNRILELKKNICYKLTVNAGSQLKNIMLGKRMLGLLASKAVQNVYDLKLDESQNIGVAGDRNTELLGVLQSNKRSCWDSDTNSCGVTDSLKTAYLGLCLSKM